MVNIHLNIKSTQALFLSVPIDDIQRLSLHPLKWLRFVTFTVCGAHGDLSETVDGPAVDYGTSFTNLADDYYYIHCGDFIFIDCNGSNDRISSSSYTQRRSSFRRDIMERDGHHCVFTRMVETVCDAAHIIPHSKGDKYINKVIQDRSILYDTTESIDFSGIDAAENGIFVRMDLHALLSTGSAALLKTPNFALDTSDIPRLEPGQTPPSRITLQNLEPPSGLYAVPDVDASPQGVGAGNAHPPAIILDYMYGVAAFKRWDGRPTMRNRMQNYLSNHYESIPPLSSEPSTDATDYESDDSRFSDYLPPKPPTPRTTRTPHTSPRQRNRSSLWAGMIQSMDEMNIRIMGFKGITPEVWAAERQRKAEEEQKKVQEASRDKVMDWLQVKDDVGCGQLQQF